MVASQTSAVKDIGIIMMSQSTCKKFAVHPEFHMVKGTSKKKLVAGTLKEAHDQNKEPMAVSLTMNDTVPQHRNSIDTYCFHRY